MEEKYNGWKNRDTWLVALWLNNNKTAYNWSQRILKGKSLCT